MNESAEIDEARRQQVMMSNQTPKKQWTSECFDESRIPEAIKILRLSRQKFYVRTESRS